STILFHVRRRADGTSHMKRRERKPWWRFRSDSDVLIDRLIRIFGMHICGSSDGSDWECRDGERRGEGVSLPGVSIDAGLGGSS
ncbi:hypothetical protein NPIL_231211, partial [Nephila pilipes]